MHQRITQTWEELSDFIVFRNSLDLGALSRLMDLFLLQNAQDLQALSDQTTAFLAAVASQTKVRSQGEADSLAVLAIDALISNLYSHTKNGESFQPNSSSFYGWMSSSQMSMDHSNVSEREGQLVPEMIAALANSETFFKRLKSSMEKGKSQEQSKRYVEGLLETIDSILGIQKMTRENFNKLRGKYVGLQRCRKLQMNYSKVNQVVFSSQLNKVVGLLTEGADNVHLALLRIYLSWNQDGRMFEGVKFSGDEMLANLYRYYISSFRDIEDLFQEGKHPLFRLIRNHLALYFTPTLRKFHQTVVKVAPRCGTEPGFSFYKAGLTFLQSQLSQFINQLPNQLLKLLTQLKDLVEQQYPSQPAQALTAVKKMFFYSFLLNQSLMEELYPRHDPSRWSVAYNHVLNLFFQSSLRKYSHLPEHQQQAIARIVDKLSGTLDDRIVHQYVKLQTEEMGFFKIKESILNHDYEVVLSILSTLEFTPKDSKQFQMKKAIQVAPESPISRHFKTQTFQPESMQSQLQLATWMSVGGSHDYSSKSSKAPRHNISARLKGLHTIDAKTRSKLSEQSASLLQYFRN